MMKPKLKVPKKKNNLPSIPIPPGYKTPFEGGYGHGKTSSGGGGLVGSGGKIDNFDGSREVFKGDNTMEGDSIDDGTGSGGAGGGTGSALAGKEAVEAVGNVAGRSLEEVVYGVKRKRAVGRKKGMGE